MENKGHPLNAILFSGSYPSPGTSLSFSPSAWSWLEKLTNSALSSQSCGRFFRSLAMARRAARSSLLRSSSLFLLLRTGFGVCFLDMVAAVGASGQQHQGMSGVSNQLALGSTTAIHLEPGKDTEAKVFIHPASILPTEYQLCCRGLLDLCIPMLTTSESHVRH